MANPALEACFGSPESVERLSTELRETSTELESLKGVLDGAVSGCVPAGWEGAAATAFQGFWREKSEAIADLSRLSGEMSMTMRDLSMELRTARGQFQGAEAQAAASRCQITPAYVVVPASSDPGAAAAAAAIQPEVTASVGRAKVVQASVMGIIPQWLLRIAAAIALRWILRRRLPPIPPGRTPRIPPPEPPRTSPPQAPRPPAGPPEPPPDNLPIHPSPPIVPEG